MRKSSIISVAFCFAMESCSSQTNYYQATGIIDKTKDLSRKNEWTSLTDKERLDGYTRIGDSIFGGEIACNVKPLKNIDIKTFLVLPGTQYAKDVRFVYYPTQVVCKDYTDCGVCYYEKFVVENANPSTFQYLGKEYATDGRNVYFRGELLSDADATTFKVIDGPRFFYFAIDKNKVYKHNQVFKEADPATFYFAKDDFRNDLSEFGNKYIIADKDKVWEYTPPDQIKLIPRK